MRAAGATAAFAGLALAGGCNSLFGAGDTGWTPRTPDLRRIAAEPIETYAIGEPRDLATASAALDVQLESELMPDAGADGASAAPVRPITLAEVRAAALANNLDLAVQRIAPRTAAERIREERARFEAVFDGAIRWSRTDQPVVLSTESPQSEFVSLETGVSVPLRTGGTVGLSVPISESRTNNSFSLLNPSANADVRFTISQPLLRDAGRDVTTYGVQIAEIGADAEVARTRLEAIRVLAAADRAYWRLYASRRDLEVAVQQLELARRQEDRARRRVTAGDAAEVEILRAQSGTAQRVESVIIAENAVRRTRRNLKRIMADPDLPLEGDVRLEPATEPAPVGLDVDRGRLVAVALDRRMEMLELELQLAIDRRTIDLRRNERLPLLTLDYSYNVNGLGRTFNDAFDQLPSRRFDDWSIGLTARIPIGNEAAISRYEQAVLARVQRLATREQRAASIRQEVLDATDALRQAWLRIVAARREVLLAARTFEAEERQFEVRANTSTDVLDAASSLARARFSEIQAITDHQIAQVDLAFATGTLLGYGEVDWLDPDAAARVRDDAAGSGPADASGEEASTRTR